MTIKIKQLFKSEFPSLASSFDLKPFQESVISHIINNGSTLAVMPTGGGKSLIYWLASRVLGGTCFVISPLIALIDEQTQKLTELGFNVLTVHSGLNATDQNKKLKEFANHQKDYNFIFASPERIATDGFFEYCIAKRKDDIKLVVIDEIHCVSQWGFDFRPFYKRIPDFLNLIYNSDWPAILGLTATINPKELNDICTDFNISINSVLKDEILLRFDLDLKVEKYITEEEKEDRLWEIINDHSNEKILVYLYRKYHKRGVEDLSEKAVQKGINAISFHGDLTGGDRQEILKDFKSGIINVVFATNAFGMGIDIHDIKVVIHFMMPESIEQYYQEIGRAGRDHKGATAYILYSNKNIQIRRAHFIDRSFPKPDKIINLFSKVSYNQTGRKTLQYFEEEDIQDVLPYFINCHAIELEGKGFTKLNIFKNITNPEISTIISSTKTSMAIPTMEKPSFSLLSPKDFFNKFYEAILKNEVTLLKNVDKCLIINTSVKELAEEQIQQIDQDIAYKRQYKHNLLDYLSYILDNYEDSKKLHQEIGRYLGVPKHLLDKIYETESGDWVRSKSEVIISNILFRSKIKFKYEEKLFYTDRKWIEPDFTIIYKGKTWYWEHLGMLGDDQYDKRWTEKKEIYKKLKVHYLITTKESCILSNDVNENIKLILNTK